ncbi:MAG TPA: glycosyltransferase [Bacteroidota bacterium]|nr:glycosyltransferase [Bacteroidota bacterium]
MTRVAMFIHGGIVPSSSTETVPALRALVGALAETFDVTVYTTVGPDGRDAPFTAGRGDVKFVRARQDDNVLVRALRTVSAFSADHRARPYALVHGFWGLPGGLAAVAAGRRFGVPSVVTLLGGEAASLPGIGYGNMRTRAGRALTLRTCSAADALTVLTRTQLDGLRRFNFGRERELHVIPFGTNAVRFSPVAAPPGAPPFHFLHVGHINGVKDQATLLRAFRIMRTRIDARLRIVGEDTLGGSLQALARELGVADQVTFAGYADHDSVARHFAWAHMLLHTSLYEGQGVVFAEAAASGIPICGTHVGLLADMGASFARTVPPGDPAELAHAAIALLGDPEAMAGQRATALAWAREHSEEWTAGRFTRVYMNLAGEPLRPGARLAPAWSGLR